MPVFAFRIQLPEPAVPPPPVHNGCQRRLRSWMIPQPQQAARALAGPWPGPARPGCRDTRPGGRVATLV
jgi:hypothetical protein